MIHSNTFIKYSALLILLPLFLQVFGFIKISFLTIFSFAAFFSGLLIFYNSFGTKHVLPVFIGTGVFLVGVFTFLVESFLIDFTLPLGFAATFYIIGFSLLLVFVEDVKRKKVFYMAAILLTASTIISVFTGNLNLTRFFVSLVEVVQEYWLLLLSAVATILFLYYEQTHSKK